MKTKILVCTRGKKCPRRGSLEIYELIKSQADGAVKVIPSKCLGMCKKGPAVVVTPGKLKLKKVSRKDAEKIAQGDYQLGSDSKKKKKKK